MAMELRKYQSEAVEAVIGEWNKGRRKTLLVLPTGCHEPSQLILMADGSLKHARDISLGDYLLGPDGTPREVLRVHVGIDRMFKVTPIKGEPFIVSNEHILPLVSTSTDANPKYPSEDQGGKVDYVRVSDYQYQSKWWKHVHKLYRSGPIRFPNRKRSEILLLHPHFVGVLLGDGGLKYGINVTTEDPEIAEEVMEAAAVFGMDVVTAPAGKATTYHLRNSKAVGCRGSELRRILDSLGMFGKGSGEKAIPVEYKTGEIWTRLQVLAGLIDTDGSLDHSGCGYDYITKSKQLADDIVFVSRSLGLAAYAKETTKRCGDYTGLYHRIHISGNCEIIPCRVEHKKAHPRRQKKDVLRTGIKSVEYIGEGEYVGFTVDGDNLYLMGDFTVTHNCGKTICFAKVAERVATQGKRTLILAHRGELLDQARDKIAKVTGLACSVEKAGETSIGTWESITVGSVQTLMRDSRLNAMDPDRFGAIVVDEAHHAASDSYRKVLDHFTGANVLGVTATPDRADRKNLGTVFDSLAYEYTLPAAIREGYLCPIKAQTIPLNINISGVSTQSGDYAVGELGDALKPYLEAIADAMATECAERKTVVFLPLVRTAKRFRDILIEHGLMAVEVDGQSEDRAEILQDFQDGRYDVLCNSMLLTEGWDCPSVDCIVVLRATKSRALYCQMVGRGTRLSPGKDHLLLLDFLWMTGRHELCRPASLVARSEDVANRMTATMADACLPLDLMETEEQSERDAQQDRERALAAELEAQRHKKAKLVDPLQYEMSIMDIDLQNYEPEFSWQSKRPTDKQLQAIEKFGINADQMDAGKASLILDRLIKRKQVGLSTPKQIRFLERKGFRHVGSWTAVQASKMIGVISRNNWRVPPNIVPSEYVPKSETEDIE